MAYEPAENEQKATQGAEGDEDPTKAKVSTDREAGKTYLEISQIENRDVIE